MSLRAEWQSGWGAAERDISTPGTRGNDHRMTYYGQLALRDRSTPGNVDALWTPQRQAWHEGYAARMHDLGREPVSQLPF